MFIGQELSGTLRKTLQSKLFLIQIFQYIINFSYSLKAYSNMSSSARHAYGNSTSTYMSLTTNTATPNGYRSRFDNEPTITTSQPRSYYEPIPTSHDTYIGGDFLVTGNIIDDSSPPSRYRPPQRRLSNALLNGGGDADNRRARARSQSNDRMFSLRTSVDFDIIDMDSTLGGIGGSKFC